MELVLLFRLADETYGLEVAQVQEIVEAPNFDYIPLAPPPFVGAINFHGSILPVIDLPGYLGFAKAERDGRVIVLPPHICILGLTVTVLGRIVPLARESLLPPGGDRQQDAYIRGVINHCGEMINLLDIPRLLASLEGNTTSI